MHLKGKFTWVLVLSILGHMWFLCLMSHTIWFGYACVKVCLPLGMFVCCMFVYGCACILVCLCLGVYAFGYVCVWVLYLGMFVSGLVLIWVCLHNGMLVLSLLILGSVCIWVCLCVCAQGNGATLEKSEYRQSTENLLCCILSLGRLEEALTSFLPLCKYACCHVWMCTMSCVIVEEALPINLPVRKCVCCHVSVCMLLRVSVSVYVVMCQCVCCHVSVCMLSWCEHAFCPLSEEELQYLPVCKYVGCYM